MMYYSLYIALLALLVPTSYSYSIPTRRQVLEKFAVAATAAASTVFVPQSSRAAEIVPTEPTPTAERVAAAFISQFNTNNEAPEEPHDIPEVATKVRIPQSRKLPLPRDSEIVRNTFVIAESDLRESQERLAYFRETILRLKGSNDDDAL
jgi:hypothetical protein